MNGDPKERRNGYTELVTDIAVIKNEIKHVKLMLQDMNDGVTSDEFKGHIHHDRLLFTIMIGLLLVLLKGVFF